MENIFRKFVAGFAALSFVASSFAATTSPVQLLNPTGSASGQAVVSTGASTAPGWSSIVDSVLAGSGVAVSGATGNVTISLAQIGANTLLGNATGSTANVVSVAVTGCNGAAQALQWTSGTGFGCNSTIATSGANANITSLIGITTPIPVSEGGTGAATLTSHGVLLGEGTSAVGQTTAGTTGQVLVGSTGANPAFGTTVAGLTFTSAITPQSTGGIVGTTTNDSANVGSVGEFPTPTNLTGVSLTSSTAANVASISLTAGDWDVSGVVRFNPGGSATTSNMSAGISTTSATFGAFGTFYANTVPFGSTSGVPNTMGTPSVRISVATTTTVYLVSLCTFSASTMTSDGLIRARRVR